MLSIKNIYILISLCLISSNSYSQLLKKDYSVLSYSTGVYTSTLIQEYTTQDTIHIRNTYSNLKFQNSLTTEKVVGKRFGYFGSFTYSFYNSRNLYLKLIKHWETKIGVQIHIINKEKHVVSLPISISLFNKIYYKKNGKNDFESNTNFEIGVRYLYNIKGKYNIYSSFKLSTQSLNIPKTDQDPFNYSISEIPITFGFLYILDNINK